MKPEYKGMVEYKDRRAQEEDTIRTSKEEEKDKTIGNELMRHRWKQLEVIGPLK